MSEQEELTPQQEVADESGGAGRRRPPWTEAGAPEIGSWLEIGQDGTVTVYTGKVEVGQTIPPPSPR